MPGRSRWGVVEDLSRNEDARISEGPCHLSKSRVTILEEAELWPSPQSAQDVLKIPELVSREGLSEPVEGQE